MPIFGGSKRPKLDGLTKEEERRRDVLNPEVLRRSGEKGVAGQAPAALAILHEKAEEEPGDFLWACLLGWQYMSARRFSSAIEAFNEAIRRAGAEVRAYYGAGHAYFSAGEAKQNLGPATPSEAAPEDLTVDNLYQESLRCFRRGLDLAADKGERDQIRSSIAAVEKMVARKAGRL